MMSYFKELLRIFNAEGVEYLVVGGHAVMHYTEPRFTKDQDVWVNPAEANARKVFQCAGSILRCAICPRSGGEDFAIRGTVYQIGVTT